MKWVPLKEDDAPWNTWAGNTLGGVVLLMNLGPRMTSVYVPRMQALPIEGREYVHKLVGWDE